MMRLFKGKKHHHPVLHVTLVLGASEGFTEQLLDFMSQECGQFSESPETYLLQVEQMLENGEITEEDLKQFIADQRK